MFVKDILREKGHQVFTIDCNVTLLDVVDELVDRGCGALVVTSGDGKLAGIVTERDILRACAAVHQPLASTALSQAMQADVVTAKLTDKVSDLMQVMTNRRIRHLPVLEDNDLVGIVSIGDVVKAHEAELQTEKQMLMEYIQS